jgi:D-glycero-alpha-D-manno-heptose 1-phosphate guanylyltransferase
MEAIILAGGLGTRLRSVVSNVPKPMAPINNKPFLEYLLKYWISQGVSRFILSVGYKHCCIINYFGSKFDNINIEYVIEDKPLGTGGALLESVKKIHSTDPFVLINGDTFFQVQLKKLMKFHLCKNSSITVSLFKSKNFKRYKELNLDNNCKITFDVNAKLNTFVNGGVYLINLEILKKIKHKNNLFSFESEIDNLIMTNQSIFGLFFNNKFLDIGTPDDYKKASNFLKFII